LLYFFLEMANHQILSVVNIHPVKRQIRDARVLTIFEGTSEIHNIIVAREPGL